MKIEVYDSTLREGAQRSGVVFSDYEKLKIITCLDSLGTSCIETGFFCAADAEALSALAEKARTERSVLSALCATVRPGTRACDDPVLRSLAASRYPAAAVVGKASASQVSEVLGTTPEENLRMIGDTVSFLKKSGKTVFFDAEHFFDGWKENSEYALASVTAARDAGADAVVLCDTNGGSLPRDVGEVTEKVCLALPGTAVGIHCHNDIGMADASTVAAVCGGASHVQLTVMGIGERCGNADLTTVVPVLQLKLGHSCIPDDGMKHITEIARKICHTANLGFDECAPFVGEFAFSHKAGMHIDALLKQSDSFEHIDPSLVGNRRTLVVSELAGKAAVREMLVRFGYEVEKDDPVIGRVQRLLRSSEAAGMQFDSAEASLRLIAGRAMGDLSVPFAAVDYKLIFSAGETPERSWSAVVRFDTPEESRVSAGEGDGPVNALDVAAHSVLDPLFPGIENVKMLDIKARIDSYDSMASASIVRVFVESGCAGKVWHTMGASTDIIAASWMALCDAYEYYLNYVLGK